jgi:surface protein
MGYMFDEASAFKEQNLSSWDVSKVKNHRYFMRDAGNGNIQPNWK